MTRHELKCEQVYFDLTWKGEKPFEIRLNDRCYQKGDKVTLKEVKDGVYTDRAIEAEITCVVTYAQQGGYVVLGLKLEILINRNESND